MPRGMLLWRYGSRCGNHLYQRQALRSWESLGQQTLDVGLTLPLRRRQELFRIPGGQMRRQQTDSAEMEPAFRHRSEQGGELPADPRRLNPFEYGIFGKSELLHAVHMHRGISSGEIQLPGIDLGQMGQKEGRDAAIAHD